jgi:hypothetical protein
MKYSINNKGATAYAISMTEPIAAGSMNQANIFNIDFKTAFRKA